MSVGPQYHAECESVVDVPTTGVGFREFADERSTLSFHFQKKSCRAGQELSVDIK